MCHDVKKSMLSQIAITSLLREVLNDKEIFYSAWLFLKGTVLYAIFEKGGKTAL